MTKQWICLLGCLVVLGLSAGAEAKEPPFDPVSIKERASYRLMKQGHAYRVDNPAYEASFTDKGLSFVPLTTEGTKREEIRFSLKAIHGGEERVSFTKEAFEAEENRITYALSRPVEEVYIAREKGIEQVFHVKAPLCSKEEDLVLAVAAETGLRPGACPEGIGFFDTKGRKVATYGSVTVFDAKGREISFLPELRGDQIALVVPGAFLKDAAYPITVDPLIGDNFPICNQGNNQFEPAVAFDGTTYLVVWRDERNPSRDIYGHLVSTAGALVGTTFVICNEGNTQNNPAIAFDGTNYLVVWEDYRNGNFDIYGQRVSTAGALVGTNFAICNDADFQWQAAIAFDGTNYLVVWEDHRNTNRDIYGQRVSTAGALVGGNFAICNQADNQERSAVAFDGTNYLVVWEDWRNGFGNHDIHGQRVSTAGALVGTDFAISNQGDDQYYPAIAFDGTSYLVAWEDRRNASPDIYGQQVSTAGGLVGGNFAICNQVYSQDDPAIAFDPTNYLVVWQDYRNVNYDIYAQRVGDGLILHKAGARWLTATGWELGDPYTPGGNWAVDLEYDPTTGFTIILHKAGALWTSLGWYTGPPYIPGSNWAVDLEYDLPTGSIVILHKAGAWFSNLGAWWTAAPYTPGGNWAVDLEYNALAGAILHKAGALWTTWAGWWTGDPFIPGSDWARDLEFDPFFPGDYLILHKAGAVWKSWRGWDLDPPYTPGGDWARDLELPVDWTYFILHKSGAMWDLIWGWDLGPPHTPGVAWAVDSEFAPAP